MYRAAVKELAKQDIEVVANFVGEMLTVQEQVGFRCSACMDDELLRQERPVPPVPEEVGSPCS